jgi:SulP family sulfate permease
VGNVDPAVLAVILSLRRVPYLDASGVHALERAVRALRRGGRLVVVSGVHPDVRRTMDATGLSGEIGEAHVWEHLEQAIAVAREHVIEERMKARARGETSGIA